jgi:hypothetical protein
MGVKLNELSVEGFSALVYNVSINTMWRCANKTPELWAQQ